MAGAEDRDLLRSPADLDGAIGGLELVVMGFAFSYGPFHSVVEVSKADYDACSITGHCSSGMKVEINTVPAELGPPTVNSGALQSAQLTGDSSPLARIMAQGVSAVVPDSTLTETVPIAQPSAGNCFSPVTNWASQQA
ncbi:uncharacterized protein A4U43_C07F39000 [Asparagus officinalis]|uniref:Uncharacterized protein n=1 Tax=Asparagus officinalis TaxID=4686 RepID=A0A5P1EI57_ASPOF|nr:uncharacterized protein A4U43_C07F39000 [Asparagus officinalis]